MLVQVSESEINDQLETLFLTGGLIPPMMTLPVNLGGGLTGTATILFQTPVADLDRPRPQMGITLPFANSQFAAGLLTLAPLGGTIDIVDALGVIVQGSDQIVTMDFNSGAPTVTVTFDTASVAVLQPALTAAGLTIAQAQNMVAAAVMTQLQTGIGRVDLTPPIPVVRRHRSDHGVRHRRDDHQRRFRGRPRLRRVRRPHGERQRRQHQPCDDQLHPSRQPVAGDDEQLLAARARDAPARRGRHRAAGDRLRHAAAPESQRTRAGRHGHADAAGGAHRGQPHPRSTDARPPPAPAGRRCRTSAFSSTWRSPVARSR